MLLRQARLRYKCVPGNQAPLSLKRIVKRFYGNVLIGLVYSISHTFDSVFDGRQFQVIQQITVDLTTDRIFLVREAFCHSSLMSS